MTAKTPTPTKVTIDKSAPPPAGTPVEETAPANVEPPVADTQPPVDDAAQGVAKKPRMVATTYGGIMVCLSTGTVYDGPPREAVECGWLQDQLNAGTMYEVKE